MEYAKLCYFSQNIHYIPETDRNLAIRHFDDFLFVVLVNLITRAGEALRTF